MACARFFPGMYRSFLDTHATFALPPEDEEETLQGMPIKDVLPKYPHYALFMVIHLGNAFSNVNIEHNIGVINAIPAAEITANVPVTALMDRYGIAYPDDTWD